MEAFVVVSLTALPARQREITPSTMRLYHQLAHSDQPLH